MQLILTNLKHFFATLTLLLTLAFAVALYFGIDVDYGDDDRAYKVGDEGPHVFFQGDQLQVSEEFARIYGFDPVRDPSPTWGQLQFLFPGQYPVD